MTKRSRTTERTEKRIRDTSACEPRLEPSEVAAALGAEESAEKLEDVLAPITLFVVRAELFKRLQSSGGRPALTGTSRRAKIPLSDKDWLELEEMAAALSSPGFAPSAGQVASVLLTLSVHAVAPQVSGPSKRRSTLARELAELAAAEASTNR